MYLSETKKMYGEYIAGTYSRADLVVDKGRNATCYDESGKAYVDFSSGIGVNSLGVANPQWLSAVKEQLEKLEHISNLYYTQPQVKLAKALCEKTGMSRVFFANSGAEANEGAIKTARKYSSDKYSHNRCEIITLVNSFHGRTIATLAATGQEGFHRNFGPFPAGFVYARANDSADLQSKITSNTCAIMIECVQGEGGVIPLEESYVKTIEQICGDQDILLVVDEVQTGVGRTGKFLCSEHYGLKPDVVSLAKGLGGGLPIGAVLFGEKTKDTLGPGDHGSTFGGNPVVCAGALEIVKALDGKMLDSITEKGLYLAEKAAEIDGIVGVTGKGMMLGLELEQGLAAGEIVALCIKEGLIMLTAKAKLRMLPPLTISYDEMDRGLEVLKKVLVQAREELAAAKEE